MLFSVVISGGIAFVLAGFGYFSILNLIIILFGICLFLLYRHRKKIRLVPFEIKINYTNIAFFIVVILSTLFFTPPSEWIIGDFDAGIYFNTGVHTSNTGSLIIFDSIVANMTSVERGLFLKGSELIMGFVVTDFNIGEITPRFFHMWPTWIAVFNSIFGLLQSLFVTPFFGVLSIVTIFFFAKKLFNWKIGLISSSLLSLNFVEIYFSKMPASEILTQFLIFAGFYLILLSEDQNCGVFSILSAACFAEALFTRIDSILIIVPLFLYFLFIRFFGNWKKNHLYFINSFILFLIFYLVYVNFISNFYFGIIFGVLKNYQILGSMLTFNYSFLIILALLFIVFNFDVRRKFLTTIKNIHSLANKLKLFKDIKAYELYSYTKYLFIGVILVIFTYHYFFRPLSSSNIQSNAYNLIKLSWYLWGPGIWLGILGLVVFFLKAYNKRHFLFLGTFFIYALFYLDISRSSPWMPWFARQYLVVVIPLLIIFTVYFCFILTELISSNKLVKIGTCTKLNKVMKLITPLLLIVLAISSINTSSILFNYVDHEGSTNQIGELAEFVGDNIIIFKYDHTGRMLATPLRYTYNKDARILYGPDGLENIQEIFQQYKDRGKRLFLVHSIASDPSIGLDDYLYYEPIKTFEINFTCINKYEEKVPSKESEYRFQITIYEVSGIYGVEAPEFNEDTFESDY